MAWGSGQGAEENHTNQQFESTFRNLRRCAELVLYFSQTACYPEFRKLPSDAVIQMPMDPPERCRGRTKQSPDARPRPGRQGPSRAGPPSPSPGRPRRGRRPPRPRPHPVRPGPGGDHARANTEGHPRRPPRAAPPHPPRDGGQGHQGASGARHRPRGLRTSRRPGTGPRGLPPAESRTSQARRRPPRPTGAAPDRATGRGGPLRREPPAGASIRCRAGRGRRCS